VGKIAIDMNGQLWSQYLTAAIWTLAQINGRTDQVQERTALEKLYTCICAVFAFLIMSVFVSSITATMTQLLRIMDDEACCLRGLNMYLQRHSVSWNTAYFARKHVKRLYQTKRMQDDEPLALQLLPKQLYTELVFEARSPHLMKHPLFRYVAGMSYCMRSACSHGVKPRPARAMEVLFEKGGECEHMIFVERGALIYSTGEHLKQQMANCADSLFQNPSLTLGKVTFKQGHVTFLDHVDGEEVITGMWLSEAALWLHYTHRGALVATSDCQLLQLGAPDFANVVKQFPDVASLCGLYSRSFYKAFLAEPSDLLSHTPPPDVETFCVQCVAWPRESLSVPTDSDIHV